MSILFAVPLLIFGVQNVFTALIMIMVMKAQHEGGVLRKQDYYFGA